MRLVGHLEVGHVEGARATAGFDEHLGFVHLTHLHAEFFPLLEVSRDVDMATGTGTLTLAEVLREVVCSLDRRRIVTVVLIDFVGCAINRELALLGTQEVRARFAEPVVHDVVFHQRIDRPAVDTDVVVATGITTLFPVKVGIDGAEFVVSLVLIVLEADTGKEVVCAAPFGRECTVVVRGHGVAAALVPDFIMVRRATDFTRRTRVVTAIINLAATFVTHLVLTGVNSARGSAAAALGGARLDLLRRAGLRRAGARRRRFGLVGHVEVGVVHGTRSIATRFGHEHHFGHVTELERCGTTALRALELLVLTGEEFIPLLEVGGNVDVTALTRSLADAEELHEGGSTRLGGFLLAEEGVNGVLGTVDGDFAELFADILFARLAVPVVHDVVFGFGVLGPTVNADVAVLRRTGLGILVVDRKVLGLVIDTVTIVLVTHASQVVTGSAPVGLERTVVVVGHGGVAALIPLFVAPRRSTDGTDRVATHLAAISRMAHVVVAGICGKGSCRKSHDEGEAQYSQRTFFHIITPI